MKRNETRKVKVGNLIIGGNEHIFIQSMCTYKTSNLKLLLQQIKDLELAGCEIIRVSIVDDADIKALHSIIKSTKMPVVADIHFDYTLALKAIESGVAAVRVNPGNLGDISNFEKVILCAKKQKCAIRIGLNTGSFTNPTVKALLDSAENYLKLAKKLHFNDLVLSFKSSDIKTTIKVNELAAKRFDYPLHLGLTEAGDISSSLIRSTLALGPLLNKGLGNTIRISITGDPLQEISACKELLSDLGLLKDSIRIISCPTCGRSQVNVLEIVDKLKPELSKIKKGLTVAIMGCPVNGPGEAKAADIGIAGGKNNFVLFIKGKVVGTYSSQEISQVLLNKIQEL
ncbi:MAG: flavodoxin-dependent (E)-4-hydroxy-3-methylbut-2-enyl-diphosphate synthase [Bacilli bacterium]|nr:flavodoxin-dependent (E)-4-hydroxy-3-methylbut-2-enyl-diphosphate synthase [Bacilli bacterium]